MVNIISLMNLVVHYMNILEKNKQWNNFLKKIKYKDPLSFLEVGKLIHDIMNPFWMSLSS